MGNKNVVKAAAGIVIVMLILPVVFILLAENDVLNVVSFAWMLVVNPAFFLWLGITSGKNYPEMKYIPLAAAAGFLVGNLIIFGTLYINSILFMAIFCLMGTGIMHATARTFHKK